MLGTWVCPVVKIHWATPSVTILSCVSYFNKKVLKYERTKLHEASVSKRGFPYLKHLCTYLKGCKTLNRCANYIKTNEGGTQYRVCPYRKVFILITILFLVAYLYYHITLYIHSLPYCNHLFASFPFPLDDQQLEAHDILIVSTEAVTHKYLMGLNKNL